MCVHCGDYLHHELQFDHTPTHAPASLPLRAPQVTTCTGDNMGNHKARENALLPTAHHNQNQLSVHSK